MGSFPETYIDPKIQSFLDGISEQEVRRRKVVYVESTIKSELPRADGDSGVYEGKKLITSRSNEKNPKKLRRR